MKFITGVAWIWGVISTCGFVVHCIDMRTPEDAEEAAKALVYGIPAWAWLLARYVL